MSNNRPQISIQVTLSDKSRRASVILPVDIKLSRLLEQTISQWNLPPDSNYTFRLERDGQKLDINKTLLELNIVDDMYLLIFRLL